MDKTTTNPSTDWEKEFDEKFDSDRGPHSPRIVEAEPERIKIFIHTLLSRKEEEVRKDVVAHPLEQLRTLIVLYGDTEPEKRIMPHIRSLYQDLEAAAHPKQ